MVTSCGGALGVHLAWEPKAGLWWTGQAVGRGSDRRALGEEWGVVVGVRWPLGQHRRGVGVVLHTPRAVDTGRGAPVILVNVPRVAAHLIIEAVAIKAVNIGWGRRTGQLLKEEGGGKGHYEASQTTCDTLQVPRELVF